MTSNRVPVTVEMAKANPEYWSFVEHIFTEQAARISQSIRRAHKEGSKPKKLDPIVSIFSRNTMSFLYEMEGTADRSAEYAKFIRKGKWDQLDFEDPEFKANIYKALRLAKITKNQAFYALYLRESKIEFKNSIKIYAFEDEKGPYSINNIEFITTEKKQKFQRLLKEISAEENCYASINLSKKQEVLTLYTALADAKFYNAFVQSAQFKKIMRAYLEKNCSKSQYEKMLKYIGMLEVTNPDFDYAVGKLSTFLRSHEKEFVAELSFEYTSHNATGYYSTEAFNKFDRDIEHSSVRFQQAFLFRGIPQMPSLEISPDHNPKDPKSPTCCMILPSLSAQVSLEKACFDEHATLLVPQAGKISIDQLRAYDENPEIFGLKTQARLIEAPGPGLLNQTDPHKFRCFTSTLMRHDLYHGWLNSTNSNKALFRYIRNLLSYKNKFYMSKKIWKATDMDMPFYLLKMAELKSPSEMMQEQAESCFNIINQFIGEDFFTKTDKTCDYLLVTRDMVKNSSNWVELLKLDTKPKYLFGTFKNFKQVIKRMERIVTSHPKKSELFHILAYRLQKHDHHFNLVKQLDEIGFEKFVTWSRNNGLMLTSSSPTIFIDQLNSSDLFKNLTEKFKIYQKTLGLNKANSAMFFAQDKNYGSNDNKSHHHHKLPHHHKHYK